MEKTMNLKNLKHRFLSLKWVRKFRYSYFSVAPVYLEKNHQDIHFGILNIEIGCSRSALFSISWVAGRVELDALYIRGIITLVGSKLLLDEYDEY